MHGVEVKGKTRGWRRPPCALCPEMNPALPWGTHIPSSHLAMALPVAILYPGAVNFLLFLVKPPFESPEVSGSASCHQPPWETAFSPACTESWAKHKAGEGRSEVSDPRDSHLGQGGETWQGWLRHPSPAPSLLTGAPLTGCGKLPADRAGSGPKGLALSNNVHPPPPPHPPPHMPGVPQATRTA